MPPVYRLACDACGYAVEDEITHYALRADDGSWARLPHPGDRRHAESVTGERWGTLVRSGRVIDRRALACLSCGGLDHYGPPDLLTKARRGTDEPPRPRCLFDPADYACKSCGARRLIRLTGPITPGCCLLNPLHLLRPRPEPETVPCPRCEGGALRPVYCGIT